LIANFGVFNETKEEKEKCCLGRERGRDGRREEGAERRRRERESERDGEGGTVMNNYKVW
jgi:hypothetical protein